MTKKLEIPRFVAESKFRSERQKATAMIKVWMDIFLPGDEGKLKMLVSLSMSYILQESQFQFQ